MPIGHPAVITGQFSNFIESFTQSIFIFFPLFSLTILVLLLYLSIPSLFPANLLCIVLAGKKTFQNVTVQEGRTWATTLTVHYVNGVNVTDLFVNSLTKNPGECASRLFSRGCNCSHTHYCVSYCFLILQVGDSWSQDQLCSRVWWFWGASPPRAAFKSQVGCKHSVSTGELLYYLPRPSM